MKMTRRRLMVVDVPTCVYRALERRRWFSLMNDNTPRQTLDELITDYLVAMLLEEDPQFSEDLAAWRKKWARSEEVKKGKKEKDLAAWRRPDFDAKLKLHLGQKAKRP